MEQEIYVQDISMLFEQLGMVMNAWVLNLTANK